MTEREHLGCRYRCGVRGGRQRGIRDRNDGRRVHIRVGNLDLIRGRMSGGGGGNNRRWCLRQGVDGGGRVGGVVGRGRLCGTVLNWNGDEVCSGAHDGNGSGVRLRGGMHGCRGPHGRTGRLWYGVASRVTRVARRRRHRTGRFG